MCFIKITLEDSLNLSKQFHQNLNSDFCRIIIEFAERKYKSKEDIKVKEKVQLYLKELVFVREKTAFKHKTDIYADWLIEIESKNMAQLLKSWRSTFKSDFTSFATQSIVDNEPVMDASIMYRYCSSRSIIPDLLPRQIILTLFKECQRSTQADIHKEFLTFSEFMEFIAFIGIEYFTKNIQTYPKLNNIEKKVDAIFEWLKGKISK